MSRKKFKLFITSESTQEPSSAIGTSIESKSLNQKPFWSDHKHVSQTQPTAIHQSVSVRVFQRVSLRRVFLKSQRSLLGEEVLKAPTAGVTGCSECGCVLCLPATYCHASAHQAWQISQPLSSGLMTQRLKCTLSNSCLPTAQHLEWHALFPPNPILKGHDGRLMSCYIAARSKREVMWGKETFKCFTPVFSSVSLPND